MSSNYDNKNNILPSGEEPVVDFDGLTLDSLLSLEAQSQTYIDEINRVLESMNTGLEKNGNALRLSSSVSEEKVDKFGGAFVLVAISLSWAEDEPRVICSLPVQTRISPGGLTPHYHYTEQDIRDKVFQSALQAYKARVSR